MKFVELRDFKVILTDHIICLYRELVCLSSSDHINILLWLVSMSQTFIC